MAQETAFAVTPSAPPDEIATEVAAAAEKPELSLLDAETEAVAPEPPPMHEPSEEARLITLMRDGIAAMSEPKTVAGDEAAEGIERARVA